MCMSLRHAVCGDNVSAVWLGAGCLPYSWAVGVREAGWHNCALHTLQPCAATHLSCWECIQGCQHPQHGRGDLHHKWQPLLMFVSCSVSCRCRYQPSRWACLLTTCLRSVRPHPTCPAMMACGTACAPQRDRPAGTSRRCTRRQGTPASILCKHTDGQLRHCAAGLLSAQLHRVC